MYTLNWLNGLENVLLEKINNTKENVTDVVGLTFIGGSRNICLVRKVCTHSKS